MSQLKPVHPGDVLREDFMKPMEADWLSTGQGYQCATAAY